MAFVSPDSLTKRYIYPPDWDGNPPGAGEDIANYFYAPKRYILHLQMTWTDTEYLDKLTIVDISEFVGVDGSLPALRTVVDKVEYQTFGISTVLYWETTPVDVEICTMGGTGVGAEGTFYGPLLDPRVGDGTDGSGNILIGTDTASASGDSLDIKIHFRVRTKTRPTA